MTPPIRLNTQNPMAETRYALYRQGPDPGELDLVACWPGADDAPMDEILSYLRHAASQIRGKELKQYVVKTVCTHEFIEGIDLAGYPGAPGTDRPPAKRRKASGKNGSRNR